MAKSSGTQWVKKQDLKRLESDVTYCIKNPKMYHMVGENVVPPKPDNTPPTQEGVDILHNNIKKISLLNKKPGHRKPLVHIISPCTLSL